MKSDDLVNHVELYSNAIVGFCVVQALAFSTSFGSSPSFNCLVKTADHLAEGLIATFLLVMILCIIAMRQLSKTIVALAGRYKNVVRKMYAGKMVVVIVFSLLPISLVLAYGVVEYPSKHTCAAKPVANAPE